MPKKLALADVLSAGNQLDWSEPVYAPLHSSMAGDITAGLVLFTLICILICYCVNKRTGFITSCCRVPHPEPNLVVTVRRDSPDRAISLVELPGGSSVSIPKEGEGCKAVN